MDRYLVSFRTEQFPDMENTEFVYGTSPEQAQRIALAAFTSFFKKQVVDMTTVKVEVNNE